MVAPVTGPFHKVQNVAGPFSPYGVYYWSYKDQSYYKQEAPFNLPLAYTLDWRRVLDNYDPQGGTNPRDATGALPYVPSLADNPHAKAYGKFVELLGEASQWATNFHERQQALDLITKDISVLIKFTRQVARYDFLGAARTLSVARPKGLREHSRFAANNWLKYHFGIEPLVKDIYAGIQTLLDVPQPHRILGKTTKSTGRYKSTSSSGAFGHTDAVEYITTVQIGAEVEIIDRDSYQLGQLGLVNPASWIWEAIPFSFVADWFTNVGQVLSSFSDFNGLRITNPYTTIFQVSWRSELWYFGSLTHYQSIYVRRSLSISGPTLHVRPWKDVSVVRGATAISLLIQMLPKVR